MRLIKDFSNLHNNYMLVLSQSQENPWISDIAESIPQRFMNPTTKKDLATFM